MEQSVQKSTFVTVLAWIVIVTTGFSVLISVLQNITRKIWARIMFIVILSLGIAWNVSGVAMQFLMFSSMKKLAGYEAPIQFNMMMNIIKIAILLMAIGMSILFGWIIKKLISPKIKSEFISNKITT